jgi:hypothetical protein
LIWFANTVTRKTEPIIFSDSINSERQLGQILMPFVENISDEVKEYGLFEQTVQLLIQPVIQTLSSVTILGTKN